MIETRKQAKEAGASWMTIKVRHADGASFELEGAFSRADANAVLLDATQRPAPGAKAKTKTPKGASS